MRVSSVDEDEITEENNVGTMQYLTSRLSCSSCGSSLKSTLMNPVVIATVSGLLLLTVALSTSLGFSIVQNAEPYEQLLFIGSVITYLSWLGDYVHKVYLGQMEETRSENVVKREQTSILLSIVQEQVDIFLKSKSGESLRQHMKDLNSGNPTELKPINQISSETKTVFDSAFLSSILKDDFESDDPLCIVYMFTMQKYLQIAGVVDRFWYKNKTNNDVVSYLEVSLSEFVLDFHLLYRHSHCPDFKMLKNFPGFDISYFNIPLETGVILVTGPGVHRYNKTRKFRKERKIKRGIQELNTGNSE